ncbi:TPA: LysR family transcriptional regulator [Klebsiella aerogenes]|nr:LysR family transcriptional regulator [Klebsiella aerogenes]HDU4054864.1 LysR family transcriptional regulator [Klebsiella aerogenes]
MNIPLLEAFTVVVREGSALRAADSLGCTQSNVTARIRQLETTLGVELFDRHGKRLIINEAGRILLPFCEQILALVKQAEYAVTRRAEPHALRLGAMESTAATRLPGVISAFRKQYPDTSLTVQIGNEPLLIEAMQQGKLEAALTASLVHRKGFHYEAAFTEKMVLVSANDTSTQAMLPGCDITLLAFASGCPYRTLAEEWLRDKNIVVKQTLSFSSFGAIISGVVAGMGLAVLPENVVAESLRQRELSSLVPEGVANVTTWLVTPDVNSTSPVIEHFRAVLQPTAS